MYQGAHTWHVQPHSTFSRCSESPHFMGMQKPSKFKKSKEFFPERGN